MAQSKKIPGFSTVEVQKKVVKVLVGSGGGKEIVQYLACTQPTLIWTPEYIRVWSKNKKIQKKKSSQDLNYTGNFVKEYLK